MISGDEVLSVVTFSAVWLQPAVWALLINRGTRLLDFTLRAAGLVALASYIPAYTSGTLAAYPSLNLLYFYGALGIGLSYALRGWIYTRALAASALVVCVGSLLWEAPILIKNAFTTGPEADWILHGLKLFYVAWLGDSVGWRVGFRGIALIVTGLILSIVWMVVFPVVGVGSTAFWNSPPYLAIRAICTVIVFTLLKREAVK